MRLVKSPRRSAVTGWVDKVRLARFFTQLAIKEHIAPGLRVRPLSEGPSVEGVKAVTGPGGRIDGLQVLFTTYLDRVRAYHCVDSVCSEQVAESPILTVVEGLYVSWEYDSWFAIAPGGSRALRYRLGPVVPCHIN